LIATALTMLSFSSRAVTLSPCVEESRPKKRRGAPDDEEAIVRTPRPSDEESIGAGPLMNGGAK
jgi:hypothetical protein